MQIVFAFLVQQIKVSCYLLISVIQEQSCPPQKVCFLSLPVAAYFLLSAGSYSGVLLTPVFCLKMNMRSLISLLFISVLQCG